MSTTFIHTLVSNGERANLECKRAQRNIPNSIWETYSAFANTYGGTILLGIEENLQETDLAKRFSVVGVEDVGAVFVHVDALHVLGVHVARDMVPLVDDQHRFACITALPGEHRAKQSRAYHQVIIFHRVITPLFIIAQIHPRVKGISQKLQPIFSLF